MSYQFPNREAEVNLAAEYQYPMYEIWRAEDAGWQPAGDNIPYASAGARVRLVLPNGAVAWQATGEGYTESFQAWRWATDYAAVPPPAQVIAETAEKIAAADPGAPAVKIP